MGPMRQLDHDIHEGIANLLADHVEQQAHISTGEGLLTLRDVTINTQSGPEIALRFTDTDGEDIWYRLELKNEDGVMEDSVERDKVLHMFKNVTYSLDKPSD